MESPKSSLFKERAEKFRSLAEAKNAKSPGYSKLMKAYERLAEQSVRGDSIFSTDRASKVR
jgi:hypothetical protein